MCLHSVHGVDLGMSEGDPRYEDYEDYEDELRLPGGVPGLVDRVPAPANHRALVTNHDAPNGHFTLDGMGMRMGTNPHKRVTSWASMNRSKL